MPCCLMIVGMFYSDVNFSFIFKNISYFLIQYCIKKCKTKIYFKNITLYVPDAICGVKKRRKSSIHIV